eukprot:3754724-Prymnesium_polylepis.1
MTRCRGSHPNRASTAVRATKKLCAAWTRVQPLRAAGTGRALTTAPSSSASKRSAKQSARRNRRSR